jgi:hypothetical protein
VNAPSLQRVREIAGLMHAYQDLNDPDRVDELRRQGLSEHETEKAIVFLPFAFARPILLQLGVELTDDHCIQDDHGS